MLRISLIKLKRIIKRTFIYSLYKYYRDKKSNFRWNENDQKMFEFYAQFLSVDDLCFDVGANIGNHVKIFLKLGSKVIAIEPQRDCVKILSSCFSSNPNLVIVPKALGKTNSETLIYISDGNTISSLSKEWIAVVKESGRF